MINTGTYFERNLNNLQLTILISFFALLIWDIALPGFSIIPTLIIASLAIILGFYSKKLLISRTETTLILFGFMLLVLSLACFLLMPNADIFEVLRMFRFFIAMISIWIICNVWNVTMRDSLLIIIAVLLIHSIAMGLQIISYDFKIFSASFIGMTKELFVLRSFGLTGAYDTAGAFLCIAILFIYAYKNWSPLTRYTLIIFIWAIGFSTGRTFMLAGSIIVISLMLYSLFSSRGTRGEKYVIFQSIILIGFIAGYLYTIFSDLFLITLEQTFDLDNLGGSDQRDAGYYAGSANTLADTSSFNLSNNMEYLFGTGKTLVQSDIGFLKTFYTYGFIIGPFMLLYIFLLIYLVYKKFLKMNLKIVGLTFFMVYVIYNIKMQSFFSSGYSEILLLLLFAKQSFNVKYRHVDKLNNSSY